MNYFPDGWLEDHDALARSGVGGVSTAAQDQLGPVEIRELLLKERNVDEWAR